MTKLTYELLKLQQVVLRACQLQNAINGVKQKMSSDSFKKSLFYSNLFKSSASTSRRGDG